MLIDRAGGGFDGKLSKNTSGKSLEITNKPPKQSLTPSAPLIQACTTNLLDTMLASPKKVITNRALSTQV